MSIQEVTGDILQCPHNEDTIIIPVNCVGVMGKGLALQTKLQYPEVYEFYKELCDEDYITTLGHVYAANRKYLLEMREISNPQVVILFPTKDHWKNPSQLTYIENGLQGLVNWLSIQPDKRKVGIPKLGCGLGGLDWKDVYPLITQYLSSLSHKFTLYV